MLQAQFRVSDGGGKSVHVALPPHGWLGHAFQSLQTDAPSPVYPALQVQFRVVLGAGRSTHVAVDKQGVNVQ